MVTYLNTSLENYYLETMEESSKDLDWRTIENDDFFKQFLVETSQNAIVKDLLSITQQLKKLGRGIAVLDDEINKQVSSNYQDLLSHASWLEKLEDVLLVMKEHMQTLLSGAERLLGEIVEPYNRIENQILILSRLHETSDFLRRTARLQHLSRRLNQQMNTENHRPDIVKAAHSLQELDMLMTDTDLNGLDIIADDQQSIKSHKAAVQKMSDHTLTEGLRLKDKSQIKTAVQVFENLCCLENAVDTKITSFLNESEKATREALDISLSGNLPDVGKRSGPGRAMIPSLGSSGNLRNRLWDSLERLLQDSIYNQCLRIELLQRVLTDHNSKGFEDISERFWSKVTISLADILVERARESSFIKQALEGEYPKFLRIFLDASKRLKEHSQAPGTFALDRSILSSFENAYLSRSVSRLLDPVHTMFSEDGSRPNLDQIDNLIRTVTSELSVSLVDEGLSIVVARNVGKAIRLFCLKCEQNLFTEGEASQIIDSPTVGQQQNALLANLLYYLSCQINRVLANLAAGLPAEGVSVIATALGETNSLCRNSLAPLIVSINEAIESIILTMHDDPEFREITSVEKEPGCSLYIRELQGFILRTVNNFFSLYNNQTVISDCSKEVASRCIELFVRHACLLRPLSEFGKEKLITDFAQMEIAIYPLCHGHLSLQEQQQYRILRAMKAMLSLNPEEMVNKVLQEDSAVPGSLVLLHLFSGAPPELLSPHQSANWSIKRLSQWLDDHRNEKERLALSNGLLEHYHLSVQQRNLQTYHPLFPLMKKLAVLSGQ